MPTNALYYMALPMLDYFRCKSWISTVSNVNHNLVRFSSSSCIIYWRNHVSGALPSFGAFRFTDLFSIYKCHFDGQ